MKENEGDIEEWQFGGNVAEKRNRKKESSKVEKERADHCARCRRYYLQKSEVRVQRKRPI